MRYVRTDATTSYSGWLNSAWIIYNPPTSRFFVTDPDSNRIFVLNPSTESVVGTIFVPGAYSIDDTANHTTLYVGTQIGDVYAIDPVNMTVTMRYLAADIGPKGFAANIVRVMADGRLALLGGQGGIPGVDGYGEFAFWDPADNSFSSYTPANCVGSNGYMGNIGVFTRSPDRTALLMISIDSDGTLCEFAEAGSANTVQIGGFMWHAVFSPDGNWIVIAAPAPFYNQVEVYDAHTLAKAAQFTVLADISSAAELFVGPDSKTLYASSDSIIYAYDLTTGLALGQLPNIVVEPSTGGSALGPISGPQFQAMDTTGLLVGPMEEGVGFLDTTTLKSAGITTQFLNAYLNPATGPPGGGTQTSWTSYEGEVAANSISFPTKPTTLTGKSKPRQFLTLTSLSDVYFGSQTATSVSVGSGSSGEAITATTPPGAAGPADVYALAPTSDGGVELLPEAYSYGPTVLEVTPNAATAEGGPGAIFGYGFGPSFATTFPSNLRMTVGGLAVNVATFNGNAYNASSPPFPLESLTYTIPAGTAGSTASVTVSSSSGSVTIPKGITYLPATEQYPLRNSALVQGIYDPHRDVYYFTDAANIQVFSRSSGAWMNPINLPTADAPQRLWGIALSPDGSKLAVADAMGSAIYVLNPSSPTAVQKFTVPPPLSFVSSNPVGVAISDAGIVYFTILTTGGTGYDVFYKLDTSSGQTTNYGIGTNSPLSDSYLRTILASDNSVVYGNDDGEVFTIDTATDAVTYAALDSGCCYGDYDLALSSNQNVFAATGYFYDSSLNAASYDALNLREMMAVSYVYGEKLSPDGRLLFQPATSGIDVLDARQGNLLERIALPITLSPNYDALVSDGTDNVLVAITGVSGDGIAVIDLTLFLTPLPCLTKPKRYQESIAPHRKRPPP